jgi:hypothetical protein
MPEIFAPSLIYIKTEIPKGNIDNVVRASAVFMKKSPGLVSVIFFSHGTTAIWRMTRTEAREVF